MNPYYGSYHDRPDYHTEHHTGYGYYNDAKVAETDGPPIEKSYMYFFRKAEK